MAERKVRVMIEVPESSLVGNAIPVSISPNQSPQLIDAITIEPIPQPKSKRQEMIELADALKQNRSFVTASFALEVINKLWPEE